MAYAILRTKKLKTRGNIGASAMHNYRERDTPNADPVRHELNIHLNSKSSAELMTAFDGRIGDQKVRKNAVLMVEYFIGASPEFFTSKEKTAQFFKQSIAWLKDKHGADNVIGCTIHQDETTPHMCAYVVPMDTRGKLNARHFLGGREKLAKIQTDFANSVSNLGLQRGMEGSKATHTEVKKYYAGVKMAANQSYLQSDDLSGVELLQARLNPNKSLKTAKNDFEAQIKPLQAKSTAFDLMTKNAKKRDAALEQLRERSAELRDIPLVDVAQAFGYHRREKDKHDYDTPQGRVSIGFKEGARAKIFNHDSGKGGGGAIDFVMLAEGVNYADALKMLSDKFGHGATLSAALERTANQVQNIKNTIQIEYTAPVPVNENWHAVREYLVSVRHLASDIVDKAYTSGKIYADKFFNAVFPTKSGCELRGTKGKFHGTRGSKRELWKIEGTDKKVAFCESAIDALSLKQKGFTGTVYSTAGANMKAVKAYAKGHKIQGMQIFAAFDNDLQGERYSKDLHSEVPETKRLKPTSKDWNADLQKGIRPPGQSMNV